MEYEWDSEKEAHNRRKHGMGFDAAADFDWDSAVIVPDDCKDYGEERWLAIGIVGERLHSVAFTLRKQKIRLISFRIASRKERKLFDEPR